MTTTAKNPQRGPIMRATIWFTSTRAGQLIYVRVVPWFDRHLMWWSKGKLSLSPHGDPRGVGGLALLTTVGARTGRLRHTPLGFAPDGDCLVMLASNAARSWHPAWYGNLKKTPRVLVTIAGGGQAWYRAEEVTPGPERERLRVLCDEPWLRTLSGTDRRTDHAGDSCRPLGQAVQSSS